MSYREEEKNMIILNGSKVSQVICLRCFRRWISARPIETELACLECPDCHEKGFAIETGETGIAEELIRRARQE